MIIKTIIVGLGNIGLLYDYKNKFIKTHSKAIDENKKFDLIGAIDPNKTRRSYFVKNFILFFNLYIFSVIFFIFLWSLKGFVFGNIVIILKIIFLLLISALFYLIFEKYNKSLK